MSAQDALTNNEHVTSSSHHGYQFDWRSNTTVAVGASNSGFRAKFYTCDGCRWQYISDAGTDGTTHQIGAIYGRQNESETYLETHPNARCTSNLAQVGGRPYAHMVYDTNEGLPRQNQAEDPTGAKGDQCGTPTYREQFAQAIRPTEDITVTKMKTKMRPAYQADGTQDPTKHDERTESGDFISADGATVSTWITKYGKMGEFVCRSFGGTTQVQKNYKQGQYIYNSDSGYLDEYFDGDGGNRATTAGHHDDLLGCGTDNKNCMTCDNDSDGNFDELCFWELDAT